MPRSVNSVAKRARRKKVLKQAKGYFGRRKMYGLLLKTLLKKRCNILTETVVPRKETFVHYG